MLSASGIFFGIILACLIVIFRAPLIKIFLDTNIPANMEAFSMAMNILIVVGLFQPIQMASVVTSNCLRGAGDNLHVALVMIICVVIIRPVLSFCAVNYLYWGVIGTWVAAWVDIVLRLALMNKRFNSGKWKLKQV